MRAEILAIGDELTCGQRVDTNSAWLSQQLGTLGIPVIYHSTVADDLEACREVFRIALGRAEVVITTGGLGPTADDLTRQALAAATQRELQLHPPSLEHIRCLFASRGRTMPQKNVIQAMFPTGSRVIPNPQGTAPGIDLVHQVGEHEARCFALPGVPAEMREMWAESVLPVLVQAGANRVIVHHRMKCFGVGESDLEQRLPDLIRRGRKPSVGITVHRATITLRISTEGPDEASCRAVMQPTIETIHDCLGSLVFGQEDDELQDAVTRLLIERGETLSTIEWGTPGILTHWLRSAPAADSCYVGGLSVSSTAGLKAALGESLSDPQPADLQQLTCCMATGTRRLFSTDYGLAIGPLPDSAPEASERRLPLALATRHSVEPKSAQFTGHPDLRLERSAKQALNMLRLRLLKAIPA